MSEENNPLTPPCPRAPSLALPFTSYEGGQDKIRIGLVCGGISSEHQISLLSARSVYEALDKEKYEVDVIGIAKDGSWHLLESTTAWQQINDPNAIHLNLSDDEQNSATEVTLRPSDGNITFLNNPTKIIPEINIFMPILHGPYGEDGTIQGFFELCGKPFVGPGVLGSAIAMDKDICKILLMDAGMNVAPWVTLQRHHEFEIGPIIEEFGLPLFVKPACQGSSIGITRVNAEEDLRAAIECAFQYDTKVLVEQGIEGRELECSVLGNKEQVATSVCGEVIPQGEHKFYDYEAKYLDTDGALTRVPAELTDEQLERLRRVAEDAFLALQLEGMSRVDFFLTEDDQIFVNEVNTIPGFTSISMYPKMWQASGVEYSDLLDGLIHLAHQRWQRDSDLKLER